LVPSLPNVLETERQPPSFDDVAGQALDHMKEIERLLATDRLEQA
jgi:hypothetical protein